MSARSRAAASGDRILRLSAVQVNVLLPPRLSSRYCLARLSADDRMSPEQF